MASSRRRRGGTAAPPLFILLAAVGAAFFVLPLAGLLVRTPWASAWQLLTSSEAITALRLSLLASLSATAIAVVLGVPLAWVFARIPFPGRAVLRALTVLPMVLPPVVGGVALLAAFGRRGLVGGWLEQAFGIHLPFTTAGAILAERGVAIAETLDHPVYDCFYLALAEARGVQLVTADRRLLAKLRGSPWAAMTLALADYPPAA